MSAVRSATVVSLFRLMFCAAVAAAVLLLSACGLAETSAASVAHAEAAAQQAQEAQRQLQEIRRQLDAAQRSAADAREAVDDGTAP